MFNLHSNMVQPSLERLAGKNKGRENDDLMVDINFPHHYP